MKESDDSFRQRLIEANLSRANAVDRAISGATPDQLDVMAKAFNLKRDNIPLETDDQLRDRLIGMLNASIHDRLCRAREATGAGLDRLAEELGTMRLWKGLNRA